MRQNGTKQIKKPQNLKKLNETKQNRKSMEWNETEWIQNRTKLNKRE